MEGLKRPAPSEIEIPTQKRKLDASELPRTAKLVRLSTKASPSKVVTPATSSSSPRRRSPRLHQQNAMTVADNAPTPHGPISDMPPTPAFADRHEPFTKTPCMKDMVHAGKFHSNVQKTQTSSVFHSPVTTCSSTATPTTASTSYHTDTGPGLHSGPGNSSPVRATPLNLRTFMNWNVSSRYRLVRLLGKGSYGHVAEAYDTKCGRKVAIKKIVNVFEHEIDCKRLYREIYILRHLTHPQVIKLLDIIPPDDYESLTDLYLVFEFVDTDLHKLIMSPQYLTIRHIQVFLYQLLCGLKYIHSANVIHRDMKPANVLLNEDCTLMICDFGLSRVMENKKPLEEMRINLYSPNDVKSPATDTSSTPSPSPSSGNGATEIPKFRRQLTKHVVTRWYRAPELILLQDYDFAVDMWSVGCIFAELLSMQVESCPRYQDRAPLFPGRSCFPLSADRPTTYSDKLDQLNVIFNVIGTPGENDIGSLGEVKQYLRKLSKKEPRDLLEMYPGAPAESLDLLKKMLSFNPANRISVNDALDHPFLQSVRRAQSEICEQNPFDMEFENVAMDKETLKARIFEEIQIFAARQNR